MQAVGRKRDHAARVDFFPALRPRCMHSLRQLQQHSAILELTARAAHRRASAMRFAQPIATDGDDTGHRAVMNLPPLNDSITKQTAPQRAGKIKPLYSERNP